MRSASRRFGGRLPRRLPLLPLRSSPRSLSRLPLVVAVVALGLSLGVVPSWASRAETAGSSVADLQVFSRPPVLVRAGEAVRIPVDVVCATTDGKPCAASASLQVLEGSGRWRVVSSTTPGGVAFDLGAVSRRALRRAETGAGSAM